MTTGSNTRAEAMFLMASDPINRAIDSLLSHETEAARWERLNGPGIRRAYEEMIAERSSAAGEG